MKDTETMARLVEENRRLLEENRSLRAAGCNLAEAAVRVCNTYDGVHRLALAVATWMTAIGNEGGRGE